MKHAVSELGEGRGGYTWFSSIDIRIALEIGGKRRIDERSDVLDGLISFVFNRRHVRFYYNALRLLQPLE